ncbi:MAG: AbrB family transcriptional regulator [Ruminococcaceae bacterium]|nr:AbrB family transcriptional regulator [Oscillospiraceae bacterium]
MKETISVRTIDTLGRVVIPKEIRNRLDIGDFDNLEISCENDVITIRKKTPSCIFCRATENLKEFQGKPICMNCINTIRNAGKNH